MRARLCLLLLASVALLAVMLGETFHVPDHITLLTHNSIEFVVILIIAMIVVVGLLPFAEERNLPHVLLTCSFLALGVLDVAHVFTYVGNQDPALAHNQHISMLFIMCAEAFTVIGFFALAFAPARQLSKGASLGIAGAFLALTALLIVWISKNTLQHSSLTPNQILPGRLNEFLLAGLYLLVGVRLWRTHKLPILSVATAALIMALSALLFGSSEHTNDVTQVLAQAYKIIAYLLLFWAMVIVNIQLPYAQVKSLKTRFQTTLDALPDLVFETSADGTIHFFHSKLNTDKLLLSPEEFLNRKVQELMPAAAIEAWQKTIEEARRQRQSMGQQYSLMMPNGEKRFEISASMLKRKGKEERFILIVRDITERYWLLRRIEAQLTLTQRSEGLDEEALASLGLDILENLANSPCSFLHLLSEDESTSSLLVLGKNAGGSPVRTASAYESTGLWRECLNSRATIIHNDLQQTPAYTHLFRLLCVPIFEGVKIRMVIGIADAAYDYQPSNTGTVEQFGEQLLQLLLRKRANQESEQSRLLLISSLESLPVGVALTRMADDLSFEYFNRQFPQLFNIDPSSLTDFPSFSQATFADPSQREQILQQISEDVRSGPRHNMRWSQVLITRPGLPKAYVDIQMLPVLETDLMVTLIEDVSEDVSNREELRIAATAFASQEGILITDADLKIQRVNQAFERSTGYNTLDVAGKTPAVLRSRMHNDDFYRAMWYSINQTGLWRGEIWNRNKDGSDNPYSVTISIVKDSAGKITHYVADYIDLKDIKGAQEVISRLSYFDTLTGLPNRESLKKIISKTLCNDDYSAALMIDMDRFRNINETQGYATGDTLLSQVAQRIEASLREGDSVGRYGGDEFVVLLPNLGDDLERASLKTQLIAQSLLNILEEVYETDSKLFFCTFSIGATILRGAIPDTQSVFLRLESALNSAKTSGEKPLSFYDSSVQEIANQQTLILEELHLAIREQQFELHYQPQFDSHAHIIGCEALLRWQHPQRGLLYPDQFLHIAEEYHLMTRIGDEVLRMGLTQLQQWQQQAAFRHLKLSLNITAKQFYEPRFEKSLLQQLRELSITPGSVMLEFTESTLLGSVEEAKKIISRLNEADIEFAIDDFGTGYSSLSYLSSLEVDQLKIDQSFVGNIGKIASEATIVRAIIDMAHALEMEVIAEGVETLEQKEFLERLGCNLYQGYLFSKPLPLDRFNALILSTQPPQES